MKKEDVINRLLDESGFDFNDATRAQIHQAIPDGATPIQLFDVVDSVLDQDYGVGRGQFKRPVLLGQTIIKPLGQDEVLGQLLRRAAAAGASNGN